MILQRNFAEREHFFLLFGVCQVFCVSFEKIFWGGKPPHSYAELLSGVNSLKRSLKVLPSHRSILVLLDKQQSGAHMDKTPP